MIRWFGGYFCCPFGDEEEANKSKARQDTRNNCGQEVREPPACLGLLPLCLLDRPQQQTRSLPAMPIWYCNMASGRAPENLANGKDLRERAVAADFGASTASAMRPVFGVSSSAVARSRSACAVVEHGRRDGIWATPVGNLGRHLRPEIYPIGRFRWVDQPISADRWSHPFSQMNRW